MAYAILYTINIDIEMRLNFFLDISAVGEMGGTGDAELNVKPPETDVNHIGNYSNEFTSFEYI